MGVYNRDGINYSAMLQNAIANRNAAAQRQAQYLMNKGKLWGDTATKVGDMVGGAVGGYDMWNKEDGLDELDAEEAQLQAKRRELIAQQAEAAQFNGQVNTATQQMQGYHPNVYGIPEPNDASYYNRTEYHRNGINDSDKVNYLDYTRYMNKIFGGQ